MVALPDFAEVSDLDDYRGGDDEAILAQAQGAIRRYCGWHVAPSIPETLTLDGSGSRSLWLPSMYVTAVASITDCGTTVDAADYDWSANGYVRRRCGCWSPRPRQIVVTLTHGYEDIPPELIGVAVSMATRRASSPAGVRREQTGPFSVEYAGSDLLQQERDILDQFKLPPRP